jgi:Na+/citrate or Na+/malate symporter
MDFYIASVVTGSVMGMNRKLLVKAVLRYCPAIAGGAAAAAGLAALAGALTGYGAREALLFVAFPILGGGMETGVIPLSKILGAALPGGGQEKALSLMIPAAALGNGVSIAAGGLLMRLGRVAPGLTGGTGTKARLLRAAGEEGESPPPGAGYRPDRETPEPARLGAGLFLSAAFFALGGILNRAFPGLPPYAWMILSLAAVKTLGILPQSLEICCHQWFDFVTKNLTGAILAGLGVAFIDLRQIALAFTPPYLLLVLVTVAGGAAGSALAGRLAGLYPIDAAITAGLCMTSLGETGDAAVLSASGRMELMPFARISSRLGGALILILSSLAPRFL